MGRVIGFGGRRGRRGGVRLRGVRLRVRKRSGLAALLAAACVLGLAWLEIPVTLEFGERAEAAIVPQTSFPLCGGGARVTCVVDGDTFWLRGEKIRIADINTPETHSPACAAEARLGERATRRLQALLSDGPFELVAGTRDTDRYGRLLRNVTRDGRSLGSVLVAEGLARDWTGRRGSWCEHPPRGYEPT